MNRMDRDTGIIWGTTPLYRQKMPRTRTQEMEWDSFEKTLKNKNQKN